MPSAKISLRIWMAYRTVRPHRFPETWCSQCGGSLGPGNSGLSRCADHKVKKLVTR